MSNKSGGGKGSGSYRPFPSLTGFVEGAKSYFTGRLPPRVPSYAPQQEVKDAFTIAKAEGFSKPHDQAKVYGQQLPPPQQQKMQGMHDDTFGFAIGIAASMATTALALRMGRGRLPQYSRQLKVAQWANTGVGVNNFLSLPNTLNERAKNADPALHTQVSSELHAEAEAIRSKKP